MTAGDRLFPQLDPPSWTRTAPSPAVRDVTEALPRIPYVPVAAEPCRGRDRAAGKHRHRRPGRSRRLGRSVLAAFKTATVKEGRR